MNHFAKIALHQDRIDGFRRGEHVSPLKLQIDPVAFCNHDCPFCMFRYTQNEDINALFNAADMLSMSKIVEILDDAVKLGVKAIELTGGGEPSLHPEFHQIVKEVRMRGFDIGLVTNGAWQEKHFASLVENLASAEWVRFSLDAASANTHKVVHASRSGDFEKACAAIEALSKYPVTVGISYVIQKPNLHEVESVVSLGQELGADYVRLAGVVFEADRVESLELAPSEHSDVASVVQKLVSESEIKVYDDFSNRSCADYPQYDSGDDCYFSRLAPAIGADGRLYLCCIWKYRPDGRVADLNEVRFSEVFTSGAFDAFCDNFDFSRKCVRCFLKPKNDFLSVLVGGIEHINFV